MLSHTNAWNGEEMPLSRSWVEGAIASIREEHQPAARLALLTALASHQVDQDTIEAFRERKADNVDLVKTVAWASLAATARISTWLYDSTGDSTEGR